MPWDRESDEEYDDGFTRESFERAEEDSPDDFDPEVLYEECYDEGMEAARRGAAVENNPYGMHQQPLQHNAWRDGVMDYHNPTGRVK
jgi:hypothetical protein